MARSNYYNNNYSPHLFVDGNIDAGSNTASWETMMLNQYDVEAPLAMDMWGTFYPDSLAGNVTVRIITEQNPALNNYKLRLALIESNINWRAPNGTAVHNQVLRDMIPTAGGTGVTLVEGDTLEYNFRFTTQSPIAPANCHLIAFVQADQNRAILEAIEVSIPEITFVGVDNDPPTPKAFGLSQNYPNPFNASTAIGFNTAGGHTTLEVYNLTGAKILTLIDKNLNAGSYSVIWDGHDNTGQSVSSGTYFYRLKDSTQASMMKMTLLK
jgi:hypothetical protein